MANKDLLQNIRIGDVITADLLNRITRAVNYNTSAVSAPRQRDSSEELKGGGAGLTDLTFTETGRTQTTVTITDSASNTHDIDQVDQVTMENAVGDILVLNFTNP